MKNLPSALACALVVLIHPALPSAQAAGGRSRVRIDDGWKFHLVDHTVGEPTGVSANSTIIKGWRWQPTNDPARETAEVTRPDFDAAGWSEIVSGHEVIHDPKGMGWFRTTLPPAANRQPSLHFDGVDDKGTVYLNGRKVGEHTDYGESFDVPLAAAWNADGPNVLTVLVENDGGPGGIDDVFLRTEPTPGTPSTESGPAAPGFDDAAWREVHLPHDFVVEAPFDPKAEKAHGFHPKETGWYRRKFTLPKDAEGQVIWLEFDGVYRHSIVWLNGHQLGQHASGYTSFYYDISRAANYGGENEISVWVDPRQNEGWWYEGGGIYRHVYLTTLAPEHIAHWGTSVTATPSADFQTAEIAVEVDVVNEGREGSAGGELESCLLGPDGAAVANVGTSRSLNLMPGQQVTVAQRLTIQHPALWSPDSPMLYRLVTTLRRDGAVLDQAEIAVGVRSLHWDVNTGFSLNGKPFKIQGTCNHQDFAGLGIALPDAVSEYKVKLLKETGSNAFRFSHQPMAPELLDACDRLGMLVMDENRRLGDSPEILGQVESLIRRDRNHPSVFLWSLCNEERAQGTEKGGKQFAAMKEVALKWDRTRPITAAMNYGWGGGITLVEDLQGFNYSPQEYDGFHQKFPQLPMYGSETASETTTRGIYADDKTKGYVSVLRTKAEEAWKPIAERPWMAGAFVWTGFDYRGEPDPYGWPVINSPMGFMDTCGFPKDKYYYYLSEWGGKPVAHIAQQWNRAGQEGQEIPVWVYGNAAKYELFLNGTSLGAKDMPAHEHLEWKVAYAPGTLEARGYDATGKTVATDMLATTGAPAKLEIVPDRTRFLADGEDVVMVRCNVLDSAGRVVPVADDEVTFSVSGPAQVAGVGNGNPSDLAPDRAGKRRAFNGHCLAVVQSVDGKPGAVTLTATAAGLPMATATFQTTAVK